MQYSVAYISIVSIFQKRTIKKMTTKQYPVVSVTHQTTKDSTTFHKGVVLRKALPELLDGKGRTDHQILAAGMTAADRAILLDLTKNLLVFKISIINTRDIMTHFKTGHTMVEMIMFMMIEAVSTIHVSIGTLKSLTVIHSIEESSLLQPLQLVNLPMTLAGEIGDMICTVSIKLSRTSKYP